MLEMMKSADIEQCLLRVYIMYFHKSFTFTAINNKKNDRLYTIASGNIFHNANLLW